MSLPYATAAASAAGSNSFVACCVAPCSRTPTEANAVRAAVIAQGVIAAAVKALGFDDSVVGGLHVLEQYAPFDPAGAVAANAVPALRASLATFSKLEVGAPLNPTVVAGKALIVPLVASTMATLAAASASGLDAATRVALAQEAMGGLAPFGPLFSQMQWDPDMANRMMTRYNNIINICNAVVTSGGHPQPLLLTNPKDIPLKVMCGPTYVVNTLSDVNGGYPEISRIYLVQPPLRIALGSVQTDSPAQQAMTQSPA